MSAELLVTSGDGPLEVRRFVAALGAELARRLPVTGWTAEGPWDAPRSLVLQVEGDAGPFLGTHSLWERRGRRRSRWFAGVHALPEVPEAAPVDPADVEIRAVRAGGPGGQAVNTTSSAVIAVHRPTGVRVRVEDERSQHQNRRRALERLAAAVARVDEARRDEAARARWRERHRVERGDAVWRWRLVAGRLVEAT